MAGEIGALSDTHCHLNFNSFAGDLPEVLQRSREAGVGRMLLPATDLASCREVLALAESDERIFAAVGVHPNDLEGWSDSTVAELRRLAAHPRVRAIGEIGLDAYWKKTDPALQRQALDHQLALAAELGLPVVIHNREATAEVLEVLTAWVEGLRRTASPLVGRPGVLHSFSADVEAAEQALALGFYIGITGPVTFKKSELLRQVALACPLERLLVETDAPFLTPHPHRGQRNEPAYVRYVVDKIGELIGLPVEDVARQTSENARRLFIW
jgi:TatD DNase family protein